MKRRCLVIGLDGATFDIIKPLVGRGKLPTLTRLMKEGVYGNLRSTIPPASMPAWPSFMTGKNPGKHGVYDFLKRTPDDYIGRLTSSRDLKAQTLWKILSDSGKKCFVINVTGTYPPQKVNGCIISGMLTPEGASYVYPPSLKEELDTKGYIIFTDISGDLSADVIFQKLLSMAQKRKDVSINLMKKFDWDFFMVLFIGTDTIQHHLWGDEERIFEYYEQIDKIVGELLQNTGENTNVIILSDHGFGPLKKMFNINIWLRQKGLLKCKPTEPPSTRTYKISKLRKRKQKTVIPLYRLKFTTQIIESLNQKLRLKLPHLIKRRFTLLKKTNIGIDWSKTKVALCSFFGTETQSIMVNLKDREPKGIVDPREYKGLRKVVVEELRKLKDPQTDRKIVKEVFTKEELYHGPYLQDAPDLVMLLYGEYKASNTLNAKNIVSSIDGMNGSHRLNGIFMAKGPDIAKGKQIMNAQIIDITPTILHLMGIKIPDDMDGNVLREIFAEHIDQDNIFMRYHPLI